MNDDCFLGSVEKRRSIYNLGSKQVVSPDEIMEKINTAVKYAPTAFNSQSARVLVLFGENYKSFWKKVSETLRQIVPADKFVATEEKIESFMAGYGTVLFFEDENVVKNLQEKFPLYKDNFPKWSLQSNGMLQFIVWTVLENAGLGASLQHYNPLIDDEVVKMFGVPESWKLWAQMPFGSVVEPAGEKTFLPLEERVKVFK